MCLGLMLSADFFLRASLAARLEVVLWVAKSAGLTRERLCDRFRQERQTKEEIFAQPVQKCIDLCVDVHVEERPVASVEVLVCFKLPSYGANFWFMFFVLRLKNV